MVKIDTIGKAKSLRGFGISFIIVGLLFVLFGISEQRDAKKLAERCRGVTVGVVTTYRTRYDDEHHRNYFSPVVSFKDEAGNSRTAVFSEQENIPVNGQEVKVYYDPLSDLAVSERKLNPDQDVLFVFKLFGGGVSAVGALIVIWSVVCTRRIRSAENQ